MLSVALGMLVASGGLLIVGVSLLYFWKIPSLVSELSGKTSRQNIKKLQKINSADEMSSTDFYNAMTSGALDEHDLDGSGGYNGSSDTNQGLSEVLSSITLDEEKRSGRRRKGTQRTDKGSRDTGQLNRDSDANESTDGLSASILGGHSDGVSGALDFTEDVSTGYFVEEEQVSGLDTPISAFSSTRVVLVTREYSSLNQ